MTESGEAPTRSIELVYEEEARTTGNPIGEMRQIGNQYLLSVFTGITFEAEGYTMHQRQIGTAASREEGIRMIRHMAGIA